MKTEITHKLIGITALILTASFISTAVQAATVTIDSLTYETNENGTASVTDCLENFTGAVTIPSSITVDGTAYTVTDIGWNAFSGCSSLKEIILPDSLSSIGWYAFYCCTSLTEIVIPDSVTFIGRSAFSDCSSLNWIYFQSQTPPEVGSLVFSGCPSNMIIYYPEGAEANWGTEWQGFVTKAWDPVIDPIPEQPTLTCGTVSKNPETGEISFTLTFTGTLQESADGITWSDVSDATEGSYSVTIQKNQNRFFRTVVK